MSQDDPTLRRRVFGNDRVDAEIRDRVRELLSEALSLMDAHCEDDQP